MIIEELMTTEATNEVLNGLLLQELSTVEAYREASQGSLGKVERQELSRIENNHRVAVEKLRDYILLHGGEPVSRSGSRGSFLRLMQGAANHLGHFAALSALKRNERQLIEHYEDSRKEEFLAKHALGLIENELLPTSVLHLSSLEDFIHFKVAV